MSEKLQNMTVEALCALTASDAPAPGGGSVSALAGAFAAALAEMVARLTWHRADSAPMDDEMSALIDKMSALRATLLSDIDRDAKSFDGFMEALKLPKATDDEKAVRRQAMQDAMKHAIAVPLSVAETALKVMPCAITLIEKGNPNAVTDALVSLLMARTCLRGALFNVKTNLTSIKDEDYVNDKRMACQALETEALKLEVWGLGLVPQLL